MGAQGPADGEEHKPFIDQVFEDQARELSPEEAAELGLPLPDEADDPDELEEVDPPAESLLPADSVVAGSAGLAEPEVVEPPPPVELADDDRALVDEAMKKSGLIWVTTPAMPSGRAFWHAWLAPTAYLLTGPGEQPDPDWPEGSPVSVLVRSKDNAHRLVSWDAIITRVDPADDDWDAATAALVAGRLNLRESQTAPARWAEGGALVYRLQPAGTLGERPGTYSDASHREAPVPTTATTVTGKPWVLHKRGHSGRPLS
jgi:hypothetical protein